MVVAQKTRTGNQTTGAITDSDRPRTPQWILANKESVVGRTSAELKTRQASSGDDRSESGTAVRKMVKTVSFKAVDIDRVEERKVRMLGSNLQVRMSLPRR